MEDRLTPVDPPITYPTIEVPLTAKKVLHNGTLKADAFTFVLKDAKGTVLAEATNQKDGTVVFPNRTFSRQVSNYIYTISERVGNSKGITYDKTVYTIKVTTWPVNGKLSYRVDVEKDGTPYAGGVTFTNIRDMPSTGDNQPVLIFILNAVALTGMLLAYNMKRRKTGSDER
jgi:pilin isopeptide linkage protein